MKTYKSFLKTLLEIIFVEEETDYKLLEQVILRHTNAKGLVELKGDEFVLTEKGII